MLVTSHGLGKHLHTMVLNNSPNVVAEASNQMPLHSLCLYKEASIHIQCASSVDSLLAVDYIFDYIIY